MRRTILSDLLQYAFYHSGVLIGRYPWTFLLVSLLSTFILAAGVHRITPPIGVRPAWTPVNSDSVTEWDRYIDFFKYGKEPYLFQVFVTAPEPNGNMLEYNRLEEAAQLNDYLMRKCSVNTVNQSGITFEMLCDQYCDVNQPVFAFNSLFQLQVDRLRRGAGRIPRVMLDYPEIRLGAHFFGVERNGHTKGDDWPTPVSHVSLVMLYYRADRHNATKSNMLNVWESNFGNCLRQYQLNRGPLNSTKIQALFYGDQFMSEEMTRTGDVVLPYFGVGFILMLCFVLAAVTSQAFYSHQLSYGHLAIAFMAVISPCLAVGAGMGLVFWFGTRFGSILSVVPFLVLAIGVDDAFLMLHAWNSQLDAKDRSVRLGNTLRHVGPSMTITSLTNAIAFATGTFTPTPEIQLFCASTALCVFVDLIWQLTMFAPVLVLAGCQDNHQPAISQVHPIDQSTLTTVTGSVIEQDTIGQKKISIDTQSDQSSSSTSLSQMSQSAWRAYSNLFNNWPFRLGIMAIVVVYLVVSILGLLRLQPDLSVNKLLLADSPLIKVNQLLEYYIWHEYYQVVVIVSNASFAIANQSAFFEFLNKFETLNNSRGPDWTSVYLRPYQEFTEPSLITSDFLELRDNRGRFVFDPLREFLDTPSYRHYKSYINYHENGDNFLVVDSFAFTLIYANASARQGGKDGGWQERTKLITRLRQICADNPAFNASIFEPANYLADQVLGLQQTTISTVLITLLCMAVVCALFIPSLPSVVVASAAIASICCGVIGCLSWWHVDLDPISMATILMSVGFSVDYTAHLSYHYFHAECSANRNDRLEQSFKAVGWPMIEAGLSTVLCVSALILVNVYMAQVFVKTVLCVVGIGLLHGLVFLPALLSSLPDRCH